MEIVVHWTSHQNGFAHLAIGLSDAGDELSLRLLHWAHNKRKTETKQLNDKLSAQENGVRFLSGTKSDDQRLAESQVATKGRSCGSNENTLHRRRFESLLKSSSEPAMLGQTHRLLNRLYSRLFAYLIFKFLVLKPGLFPLVVFMHFFT